MAPKHGNRDKTTFVCLNLNSPNERPNLEQLVSYSNWLKVLRGYASVIKYALNGGRHCQIAKNVIIKNLNSDMLDRSNLYVTAIG